MVDDIYVTPDTNTLLYRDKRKKFINILKPYRGNVVIGFRKYY